jgi:hypothetical protein
MIKNRTVPEGYEVRQERVRVKDGSIRMISVVSKIDQPDPERAPWFTAMQG